MTYKCNKCNSELEHINFEFWLCENCFTIIQLNISRNWKAKNKIDNRMYLFEKSDTINHTGISNIENFNDFIGVN